MHQLLGTSQHLQTNRRRGCPAELEAARCTTYDKLFARNPHFLPPEYRESADRFFRRPVTNPIRSMRDRSLTKRIARSKSMLTGSSSPQFPFVYYSLYPEHPLRTGKHYLLPSTRPIIANGGLAPVFSRFDFRFEQFPPPAILSRRLRHPRSPSLIVYILGLLGTFFIGRQDPRTDRALLPVTSP